MSSLRHHLGHLPGLSPNRSFFILPSPTQVSYVLPGTPSNLSLQFGASVPDTGHMNQARSPYTKGKRRFLCLQGVMPFSPGFEGKERDFAVLSFFQFIHVISIY